METITMILIWLGSGFAFAVGICAGMWVMMCSIKKETTKAEEIHKLQLEVNELLRERNAIGVRQAEAMENVFRRTDTPK